jgi:hypothetical protein
VVQIHSPDQFLQHLTPYFWVLIDAAVNDFVDARSLEGCLHSEKLQKRVGRLLRLFLEYPMTRVLHYFDGDICCNQFHLSA